MVNDFSYVILPGRMVTAGYEDLYDNLYSCWKRGWEETFKEDGLDYKAHPNNFIRHNYVVGIFNHLEVVGFHAYSLFNLKSLAHMDHSYFDPFRRTSLRQLQSVSSAPVFTMEYLYVAPKWRKTLSGISYASILIQLGLRIFSMTEADCALGVGRNNRSVSRYAYDKGAVILEGGIPLFGGTVDLFYFPKSGIKNNLTEEERQLEEKLWDNRADPFTLTSYTEKKAYA